MVDIIDSSYSGIDVANLVPSFLQWLFGGALNMENGSIWGIGLILVIAVGTFLIFGAQRYEKQMIVSALITWVVGLLSLKAGWINGFIFSLTCIYVVVGLYYLLKKSSEEEA